MPRTNVLHDKKSLDLNDRLKFGTLNDSRITNRKRTSNYENSPSRLVSGFELVLIKLFLRLRIFQIGLKKYHNPIKALLGLKKMIDFRRSLNDNKLNRFVKSNGRYFFALNVPGWPSKSFDVFIDSLYDRRDTVKDDNSHLLSLMFAITKKCPLRCEHCFEWDRLNKTETLSINDLHQITNKFQNRGLGQIQFSGGEPLQRFDDLIAVSKLAKKGTDFWVITSGYGLNNEKAKQLQEVGFTGVNISLDHWDPAAHDAFRGMPNSYNWVEQAAANVQKEDLVLALTLCATKTFTNNENLWKYAELAKKLGAGFVQILEPKAVGHYAGKNVDLSIDQQSIIENFFLEINSNKKHKDYPIFHYPAYHQKKIGCLGAGDLYMYVDSNGDAHACPFCQNKVGNCISDSIDNTISEMRERGCQQA